MNEAEHGGVQGLAMQPGGFNGGLDRRGRRTGAVDRIAQARGALGRQMGLASTLFQVAIAIGGVCLIVKKRWLWGGSLVLAALATLQLVRVLLQA